MASNKREHSPDPDRNVRLRNDDEPVSDTDDVRIPVGIDQSAMQEDVQDENMVIEDSSVPNATNGETGEASQNISADQMFLLVNGEMHLELPASFTKYKGQARILTKSGQMLIKKSNTRGNVVELTLPRNVNTTSTYDGDGNLTLMLDSGVSFTFGPDANVKIKSCPANSGVSFSLTDRAEADPSDALDLMDRAVNTAVQKAANNVQATFRRIGDALHRMFGKGKK